MRRSNRLLPFAVLAALAACLAPPAPQSEIEPRSAVARGELVAERSCSLCHQVSPAKASQQEAAAPSFMEIANLPGRNRAYLRRFATQVHVVETLGEPKPVMPTVFLTPEDREDVVAYILSFQRPGAPAGASPQKLEPFE